MLFYSLGGVINAARSPWPPAGALCLVQKTETARALRWCFLLLLFATQNYPSNSKTSVVQLYNPDLSYCVGDKHWHFGAREQTDFVKVWKEGHELFNSTSWILLLKLRQERVVKDSYWGMTSEGVKGWIVRVASGQSCDFFFYFCVWSDFGGSLIGARAAGSPECWNIMGCCNGRCTLAFICGMQLVSDTHIFPFI